MLTRSGESTADDAWFTEWRQRELSRVVRSGVAYLDYTGAALYPESLVRADTARLMEEVLGNPHSEHGPSRAASDGIAAARSALLEFLHADPSEYAVILTPNTTGACRIVAESFPFGRGSALLLSADNHNSVNGIREYARRAGADLRTIALDNNLQLVEPLAALDQSRGAPSLFAFPAQSNFSGVRHPLTLVHTARDLGWRVLLDAASYLGTSDLRLDAVKPDFVALSLYKIAGYPTGLGALVARRDALDELERPWFSGGTVRWASVQHQRHRLADAPEGFEDGTPSFLAARAVAPALEAILGHERPRLVRHLAALATHLRSEVASVRHGNGAPVAHVYGPADGANMGATLALAVADPHGRSVPYWEVEAAARDAGIAVRGGCFCNPGCAEAAFAFPNARVRSCLDTLGDHFTIPRFASCLDNRSVGAIRVSMGLGTVRADVDRFLAFLTRYAEIVVAA
ncbi:MAG TPA: aminotransferase class V-fold PLP-dependent enzyme [Gemmatimonadaceae bacterium]|nr:aminotransferase class V-fold PLP-dependent enzyme [Gemmatimonadaceae bacterium]